MRGGKRPLICAHDRGRRFCSLDSKKCFTQDQTISPLSWQLQRAANCREKKRGNGELPIAVIRAGTTPAKVGVRTKPLRIIQRSNGQGERRHGKNEIGQRSWSSSWFCMANEEPRAFRILLNARLYDPRENTHGCVALGAGLFELPAAITERNAKSLTFLPSPVSIRSPIDLATP